MKFLAMLKDSLRETLDVKLFYVMLALSLLVCLLVGSVTYRPVSARELLESNLDTVNLIIRLQLQSDPRLAGVDARLAIDDFRQTNDAPEPWLGNYQFVYALKVSGAGGDEKGKPGGEKAEQFERAIREQFSRQALQAQLGEIFKEVRVKPAPARPGEIGYVVETEGTKEASRPEWFHKLGLFFGVVSIPIPPLPLNREVEFFTDDIVGTFGAAFTMLISTIITAFFLPNMLAKGTVDFLLVKPMHRTTLLLYKFFGGLLFMFLNTVVILVGIWLGLGIQSGVWLNAFLLCIFIYTFQFAILYSVSALAAVLTRSSVVAILATFMAWGLLVLLGWTHWFFIEKGRADKPLSTTRHWAYVGYDFAHSVLPQFKDLDWLTTRMLQEDLAKPRDPGRENQQESYERKQKELNRRGYGTYSWKSALTTGGAFITLMLALACWRFATRDY